MVSIPSRNRAVMPLLENIEGAGQSSDIQGRVKQIRAQIEETLLQTTIARSYRNVWRSWSVELP